MRTRPQLTRRPEQPYVTIPLEVTRVEWAGAGALFGELFRWLARRGVERAGPPFFRYWAIGGGGTRFGLEAGVPVEQPLQGEGRVFADTIAAGPYATLVHRGHPEGLGKSRALLRGWAAQEGIVLDRAVREDREIWGGLYEFHLTDPARERDPHRWVTEIACRVGPGAHLPPELPEAEREPSQPGWRVRRP